MRFSYRTDRGIARDINEDSCNVVAGNLGIPDIFVIADGMGGHHSGEIASKTAVDYISEAVLNHKDLFQNGKDLANALKLLINETNRIVYDKSLESAENHGMGTTLIIAAIQAKTICIAHIGDSRLYLIRNGTIERVTTDHSYIEELVKNGTITREQAYKHPDRNIITKALGCTEKIEADIYSLDIKENDCFLMCTDGLTNMLSEQDILKIASEYSVDAACEELINRANQNGGEDNITVIVIKNE